MDDKRANGVVSAVAKIAGAAFFGAPLVAGAALEIVPQWVGFFGASAIVAFSIFVVVRLVGDLQDPENSKPPPDAP